MKIQYKFVKNTITMIGERCNSIEDIIAKFPNNNACIEFLEANRWPDNVVISPFDEKSKVYRCKEHRYFCQSSHKYFNVLTGTIFENTKISLTKWMITCWLFNNT